VKERAYIKNKINDKYRNENDNKRDNIGKIIRNRHKNKYDKERDDIKCGVYKCKRGAISTQPLLVILVVEVPRTHFQQ